MSTFLEIARPLAERGFRVFPLVPKDKRPVKLSWGDHFDAATTDIPQLEQWDREVPRANAGISPDENFCFLETDDEGALRAECSAVSSEVWDTTRVSARDNRCYYIFRQTMRTRKAGNMTVTRAGQENLFEFKQHRVYVVGPCSIHPKTGGPYAVEWRNIPAMPDVLLNRLCELYGAPKATDSHKMDAETARQTALLDSFLETYEVPTTGDWFNKGKQWYRPILCPWEAVHENTNQGTSTCIVYTEDGGYGFDCKHRCASKTWKEFRAEVQGRFPDRKFSFVEATAELIMGSPKGNAPSETLEIAEKQVRPIYPDAVWNGTIFGAFADIVCRGNFIRRKLASESFRGLTGAIAGDKVTCGISGVRLREYHVIIAEPQSGKNVVLDASVGFYTLRPKHGGFAEPLLMQGGGLNRYRPTGIGAQQFLPGSSNSFVDEQERNQKIKKVTVGEVDTIEVGGRWQPMPRYITIQGEALALFARLTNPDWQGRTMSALVTDLYDSSDVETPITGDRGAPKVAVKAQYSLLLYTQPRSWRKYMAGHTVDSGLFGRFYIVGSEHKPEKMDLPDYQDPNNGAELFQEHFGALRRDVFARLEFLRDQPLVMTVAPEAKRRMLEWENSIVDDTEMEIDYSSRMGLHIKRAAMARAWGAIPQRTEITVEDADAAIQLGEYQLKMRERYAPISGDSARWQHWNAVKMLIKQSGQITLRDLRQGVRGDRFPEDFEGALSFLERRGRIVIRELPKKRKLVIWNREGGD